MNAHQRTIARFYNSIPECQHSWRTYPRDLAAECEAAERQHRRGRPSGIAGPRGFSVADAGRYFAAKYLYEFATGHKLPDVADYLSYRHECFTAAAVYLQNKDALETWARGADAAAFLALDYCNMVKS